MDMDSLEADLSALGKLYRLLQINESSDPSTVPKTLDGGSQVFLKKLLDDASERFFEAHVKIMADNWRNLFDKKCMGQLEEAKEPETLQYDANSPIIEQMIKERVCAVIKNEQPPNSVPSVISQVRRFTSELQRRRKKRCLACQQSRKLEETSKNQSNGLKNVVMKARDLSISNQDSKEKKSLDPVRNSNVIGSKMIVDGYHKSSDKKSAANVEGFSKEVDDAIRRMESLIPSLHNISKPPDSSKIISSALDSDAVRSYKGKEIQRCSGPSRLNSNAIFPGRHENVSGHNKTRERVDVVEPRGRKPSRNHLPSFNESEEKFSESTSLSSWTTEKSSASAPRSSSKYSDDIDYQDVDSELSHTENVPSQSSSRYGSSSYNGSDHRNSDSEYYQPSRHSVEHHSEVSKFQRLKNKLGFIFQHGKRGESDWHGHGHGHEHGHGHGHGEMMVTQNKRKPKMLGEEKGKQLVKTGHIKKQTGPTMVTQKKREPKMLSDAKGKQLVKTGPNKLQIGPSKLQTGPSKQQTRPNKQQTGTFCALVGGAIRHVQGSNKPKKLVTNPNVYQNRGKVANMAQARLQGTKKMPHLAAPPVVIKTPHSMNS